jgi:hypothetical protein
MCEREMRARRDCCGILCWRNKGERMIIFIRGSYEKSLEINFWERGGKVESQMKEAGEGGQ